MSPNSSRLGHRRAGHAGELRVHPEIVLEGDRGERLVLVLDGDAFLGFERLVQPLGVAPALHHAAGELVDDDDLVVLDDVVGVEREQLVRPQRLVDVMDQRHVVDVVERRRRSAGRSGAAAPPSSPPDLGQGDGAAASRPSRNRRVRAPGSACRPGCRARNCPRSGRR